MDSIQESNISRMRLQAIEPLRGICAFLIFLHHFLPEFGAEYNLDFGSFCVLFFFILSGFCMTLNYKSKVDSEDFSYRSYIVRRASKLYPLHWFALFLYMVLCGVAFWYVVPFCLTLTQSLFPSWKMWYSLNGPCWFLSSLLFSYLVFPFLIRFDNRHPVLFYSLFSAGVIGYFVLLKFLPSGVGIT